MLSQFLHLLMPMGSGNDDGKQIMGKLRRSFLMILQTSKKQEMKKTALSEERAA